MDKENHMGQKLKGEANLRGLNPREIAEIFDVKAPSVYDWYENGRIAKKHYPKLVEWSGKPITWWLDMPDEITKVRQEVADYVREDPRHKVLLELYEGLPKMEQDELIRTLTKKKQHYDSVIKELLQRRNAA